MDARLHGADGGAYVGWDAVEEIFISLKTREISIRIFGQSFRETRRWREDEAWLSKGGESPLHQLPKSLPLSKRKIGGDEVFGHLFLALPGAFKKRQKALDSPVLPWCNLVVYEDSAIKSVNSLHRFLPD
jgi:hypothetical protein